ncbi:MAG: ribosome maturation factor RimP [Alphaproteobacteria bacterium]|nr:ribosome maturation factor RimP [Alphaproteobacteria bacterium]
MSSDSGKMFFVADEPRVILEREEDRRLACVVEPVICDLGFRLVRVRLLNLNGCTLQIMAERSDGTMDIGGCSEVSRGLSAFLDVESSVEGPYHLEVSSPGINRPLVRICDFEQWSGHEVKLETYDFLDGQRRFRGSLFGVDSASVSLRCRGDDEETEGRRFPFSLIREVRLVMMEDLVRLGLSSPSRTMPEGDASDDVSYSVE